nr:MAG TPA: hypothetical protein [Caudoviricetes sp.]
MLAGYFFALFSLAFFQPSVIACEPFLFLGINLYSFVLKACCVLSCGLLCAFLPLVCGAVCPCRVLTISPRFRCHRVCTLCFAFFPHRPKDPKNVSTRFFAFFEKRLLLLARCDIIRTKHAKTADWRLK